MRAIYLMDALDSVQAGGVEDCVGDLLRAERVDGDGDVGGAVEGQAALIAAGEVGLIGEDGAGAFSALASGEGGRQFDFEVDEKRTGGIEQHVAGLGPLDGPAAEGEDERVASGEAGDGGVFLVAEGGFAVAGEDFCDGDAGFGFDDVVHVNEAPAETACDERADGAFAGAHEAGEDNAAGSSGAGLRWMKAGQVRLLEWVTLCSDSSIGKRSGLN